MTDEQRNAGLTAGSALPKLTVGPITRTQLALFAGASGDHNPIHLDDAEARAVGLPGVIVQGMLMMAMLGRVLTDLAGLGRIRTFDTRFTAMAVPGDVLTFSGVVLEITRPGNDPLADLDIRAVNQKGDILLKGKASVMIGGSLKGHDDTIKRDSDDV
ncbi:MAG: MaoC/PaaZ C-terminal domain-containing protein [Paracoccaceae bacterium]